MIAWVAGCGLRAAGCGLAILSRPGCGSLLEGGPGAHARDGHVHRRRRVELEFDLTFMLSNYRCIWGRGCPDTRLQRTARGCCVDGVEIYRGDGDTPGSEDLKKIRGRVRQLTDEDWQNRRTALARGGRDPWGKARFKRDSVHTRLNQGACIFHNRVDHPGGAGCAFHVAALRRGENPVDWKPRICWQVPLFFDIDEKTKTTMVRACRTVDCGYGILEWWCTEHQDAFSADQPVYMTMEAELRARVRRRCLRRAGRLLPGAPLRRATQADAAPDDPQRPPSRPRATGISFPRPGWPATRTASCPSDRAVAGQRARSRLRRGWLPLAAVDSPWFRFPRVGGQHNPTDNMDPERRRGRSGALLTPGAVREERPVLSLPD